MINTEEIFLGLVNNAKDFLDRTIIEIEYHPKYSAIHFFAAIEILLKSRLLLEHWTLILDDPKEANQSKFTQGDFRSVGSADAIRRLRHVVNLQVSGNIEKSIHKLAAHRNKLIHSFHPEYEGSPERRAEIAADICSVWLHIFRLLTNDWRNEFKEFQQEFSILNSRMRKLRPFLEAKFQSLEADLKKGMAKGAKFHECQACGYPAALSNESGPSIIETICLVCEYSTSCLQIECPNCQGTIDIYDLGEGVCETCDNAVDMDYLETLFNPAEAYCPNCEWVKRPSVVEFSDDSYFCINCLHAYDKIDQCEWCGELNGGEMIDSYLYGCSLCDGRIAWGD